MSWTHCLSARSDFSLGESMLSVDEVVSGAARHGCRSVALVDAMSVHRTMGLSEQAERAGIRPIVACRLRVCDDAGKTHGHRKPQHVFMPKVQVLEETGWRSLLTLLSKACSPEGFHRHVCCGLEDVLALEGVAVTSGDFAGLFQHPL